METKLNISDLVNRTKNKHIVICGNYRTGSNAFGNFLSSITGKRFFSEPFIHSEYKSNTLNNDIIKINELTKHGKTVIINIHPDQFFNTKADLFLNNPGVRDNIVFIQLSRQDIIKQIVSLYIVRRNAWKEFTNQPFIVEFDYNDIMVTVKRICDTKLQQQQQPLDFIEKITYEEIVPLLNNKVGNMTPRPVNYKALISAARQCYQDFLKENTGFFDQA